MKPIYVSDETHRLVKTLAVRDRVRIYQLAEEALRKLIAERWNKKRKRKK